MGFEPKHQLLQDYQNYHKVWYLYLLEHGMEKEVFQTSALSPGYVMCFTIGVSFWTGKNKTFKIIIWREREIGRNKNNVSMSYWPGRCHTALDEALTFWIFAAQLQFY